MSKYGDEQIASVQAKFARVSRHFADLGIFYYVLRQPALIILYNISQPGHMRLCKTILV